MLRPAASRRGALMAGVLGLVLVAGCSGVSEQSEFVIYFTPQATSAQKDAVRNACPGVGNARLEPRDRNDSAVARTYPVRYDVSSASERERSLVTQCAAAQPGVRGVALDRNGN